MVIAAEDILAISLGVILVGVAFYVYFWLYSDD